jgi:solute carrier family 35 protein F5
MIRLEKEVLGFALLSSVVVVWVLSGFFIQFLLTKSSFTSPVTMTVLSVGLCSVLLSLPDRERKKDPLLNSGKTRTVFSRKIFLLGTIWLAAQLLYNMSLQRMSVSDNTAVSSSSSLFTFLFSIVLLRGYSFTLTAVAALASSCLGILLISLAESQSSTQLSQESKLSGFAMALSSCACYGLFTTLLKRFSQDPKFPKSVVTMFGNFGLVSLVLGIPLIVFCDTTGIDRFAFPVEPVAIIGIVVNALVGSVLSDILLAKSVLLLNPLTVSIGLSLSMPLSLLLDSVEIRTACVAAVGLQFTAVALISYDNHKQNRL